MLVTPFGIVIDSKEEHPLNVLFRIFVTPLGIVKDLRTWHD